MKIMIFLFLISPVFAADESSNFLKRCFLKEYSGDKAVKQVLLAISEDLPGDSSAVMDVQLKNTNGPTAGKVSATCIVTEKTFVCTNPGEGKFTFLDEGKTGTLTINEPVKLKMKNQYFPGKSSATNLPASTALKMTEIHTSGCEKLVP